MSETPKPEYPSHMDANHKIVEHWCDHPECKQWGSFGFAGRYGISWYCGEHKREGKS